MIECSVISKDRVLFSGELYSITLPGAEGELGIMENHEPFMTFLNDGVIRGRLESPEGPVICAANLGGYVQVIGKRVIVICDKTRFLHEIDLEILQQEIPLLEEILEKTDENEFITRSVVSRKLHWCNVMRAAKLKENDYLSH